MVKDNPQEPNKRWVERHWVGSQDIEDLDKDMGSPLGPREVRCRWVNWGCWLQDWLQAEP